MALYDDPDMIRAIINDRVDFYIKMLERVYKDIIPDYHFMSYRNGPLVSPDLFREFILPAYKKLTSFLRGKGINSSDGDIRKLLTLLIEGGVTGMLPLENVPGVDVVKLAEQYPKFQFIGGINKHEIAKGKEAIDAELDRVLPFMLKRGGYV